MATEVSFHNNTRHSFFKNIFRGDIHICVVYIIICVLSCLEIYSATSRLTWESVSYSSPAVSHIEKIIFGIAFLMLAQSMSLLSIRTWTWVMYIGGVLLLYATIFLGEEQKGAVRSLMGVQPVEVCKPSIIMILALLLTQEDKFFKKIRCLKKNVALRRYLLYLVVIGLVILPITTQNLSSAIIIGLSSLALMFVSGKVKWVHLSITLLAVAVAGGLFALALKQVYNSHHSTGQTPVETRAASGFSLDKIVNRTTTWANRIYSKSDRPLWQEDVKGEKSQELCAHMAIANGYPIGRFYGNSKLRDYLPEAYSDYIFAIIFEEWGPIGAAFILLLYVYFFIRCYLISRHTDNLYIRLLLIGLSVTIVIQALIHIGVCTGAMFVTGQPLPLFSRGGSSIIGTSISIGIILALSRIVRDEEEERMARENPQPETLTSDMADTSLEVQAV